MKNVRFLFTLFIILTAFFIFLEGNNQKSLADLYRTGKIRLIPALTLDESSMPKEALFGVPVSVVEDRNGNIYVSDFKMHNIKKFDSSGRFIKLLGRMGQGPGEFNRLSLMTLGKDRLVVWEMGNSRLSSWGMLQHVLPEAMFRYHLKMMKRELLKLSNIKSLDEYKN